MALLTENHVRCYSYDLTMAAEAAESLTMFTVPAGARFLYGVITASATMGASATVAIGVSGATGQYRTAATFTSANTPTLFGNVAPMDNELAVNTDILMTIAVAALPGSGQVSVQMFFGNA